MKVRYRFRCERCERKKKEWGTKGETCELFCVVMEGDLPPKKCPLTGCRAEWVNIDTYKE